MLGRRAVAAACVGLVALLLLRRDDEVRGTGPRGDDLGRAANRPPSRPGSAPHPSTTARAHPPPAERSTPPRHRPQWDGLDGIVSYSARMIAASRAVESEREGALFFDPLAKVLAGKRALRAARARAAGTSSDVRRPVATGGHAPPPPPPAARRAIGGGPGARRGARPPPRRPPRRR